MSKKYLGPLRPAKMSIPQRKAYQVWFSQRDRCSSQKHASYKYYGAKGIKVKYGSREFMDWWVAEYEKCNYKKPSVGRIDHSKDYEFGNIEMLERGDNTREMLARTGGNKCGTPVVLVFEDRTMAFCSMSKAAKSLGTHHSTLQDRLNRKTAARPSNRKFDCDVMTMDKFLGGSA